MGWDDGFLGPAAGADLSFTAVPFDHPLWVLYSSGTTGLPKPIVHGQGGILLEQMKRGALHLDAQAADRYFWFSTTGWMMWNFLVGVLLTDASIVLFDGNPGYPDLGTLWDLAADTGMTTFWHQRRVHLFVHEGRRRARLRARPERAASVGSTGSPLSPEGFRGLRPVRIRHLAVLDIRRDRRVHRVRRRRPDAAGVHGRDPGAGAGVRGRVVVGRRRPLVDEVGELAVTEPMPSMPLYFRAVRMASATATATSRCSRGVAPRRLADVDLAGTAVIYGRSDSTINRGGVRMGTSEIYRAVLAVPEVVDALVIDLPREGTEGWMPLYVVLREDASLTEDLIAVIRRRIREDCSPRHVPDEIVQIAEVPRTLSGKVLEVPVKRILMGVAASEAASRESLANPAALDYFVELAASGS